MENKPIFIILPDKIYKLSVSKLDTERAFLRDLIDFRVIGDNPLEPEDRWRTLVGYTEELSLDKPKLNKIVPFEWVLMRFLAHHVRSNSLHLLSGKGGEVLSTMNFDNYLGYDIDDESAEEMTRILLTSWIRVFPNVNINFKDIFISTDIKLQTLKRVINTLKFTNHITEEVDETYKIKPSIMDISPKSGRMISFDRRVNRYFQEIKIQADEPFCFIIMPFKEKEFPQRIYSDVIKPFIESNFKISCYRVDEDHLPDRIDNKIYTYILKSTFIIAEVSTLNPNVFYELGLAHMLEKDCIILTNKPVKEVPFDINRIRAENYKNEDELINIIQKSISALAFKYL